MEEESKPEAIGSRKMTLTQSRCGNEQHVFRKSTRVKVRMQPMTSHFVQLYSKFLWPQWITAHYS